MSWDENLRWLQLTDRQRELLLYMRDGEWVRPMDVGGFNGSHHSSTLRQLVRKGLVERSLRNRKYWGIAR